MIGFREQFVRVEQIQRVEQAKETFKKSERPTTKTSRRVRVDFKKWKE